MQDIRHLRHGVAIAALALFLTGGATAVRAQQAPAGVTVGEADLGGVVTSSAGPEAGVWVIAEATNLGTRYIKIVVTDDQGRYVMPALPKANYNVWVRGYGLVDSAKVQTAPGKVLNFSASVAPNAAAAAEYYPAAYWLSMLHIPEKSDFPGTGDKGNGVAPGMKTQSQWLNAIKTNGCVGCHELGEKSTRTIPKELGSFKSGAEAWERRIQSGQASDTMIRDIGAFGASKALNLFGDWTDRVAKGELPKSKPERPQGVERNVVVNIWDWGNEKIYMHDSIATDRRNPTVNGYGKIYGSPELSTDMVPVLDPVKATATEYKMSVRDPKTPTTKTDNIAAPSPYWGDEAIWDSQTVMHNPMIDHKGRVWATTRIRPALNPAFCQEGSDHPSAKLSPVKQSGRQLSMTDPATGKITLINTCFGTHHLQFAKDANDTLWTSSGGAGDVVGWLNTKMFDETGDEQKSQGWTAIVLDTNGNGKRDEGYNEPGKPVDPTKDTRKAVSLYAVSPSATDGSVWGSVRQFPGAVVRIAPGAHPPETAVSEYFELPWDDPKYAHIAYGPRGMDIDTNNVVWVPLASGSLGSFDRRKCKAPLNGPNATGRHCDEGWAFFKMPGPQFENVKDEGSVEASYYTWVDQHNTSGLGADVPVATGGGSEGLIAYVNGKMVTLRVPYPMGFYAKGLDGRIDDANGGWKARGLWSAFGSRTPAHLEGGKGTKPLVVQFQVRPDPLSK